LYGCKLHLFTIIFRTKRPLILSCSNRGQELLLAASVEGDIKLVNGATSSKGFC